MAKILLNSLYGKFGMIDQFDQIKIVNDENFNKILLDNEKGANIITDVMQLDDHFLVQMSDLNATLSNILVDCEEDSKTSLTNKDLRDNNINVAIASAITSYARDYMSQFKNNSGSRKLKLFYTDTDSIYTNLSPDQMNELYPGIVDTKGLGKLKLEGIYTKAIFKIK